MLNDAIIAIHLIMLCSNFSFEGITCFRRSLIYIHIRFLNTCTRQNRSIQDSLCSQLSNILYSSMPFWTPSLNSDGNATKHHCSNVSHSQKNDSRSRSLQINKGSSMAAGAEEGFRPLLVWMIKVLTQWCWTQGKVPTGHWIITIIIALSSSLNSAHQKILPGRF